MAMYQHILLPTDGSALAGRAAESGVQLAKALGARVTGLHVMSKLSKTGLQWALGDEAMRSRVQVLFAEQARTYLEVVETAARKAGVPCECLCVIGESAYARILQMAADRGCDLIYMASHGKGGAYAVLLGSETVKVLTQSPIPVLVHREPGLAPVTRVESAAAAVG